MVFVLSMFHAGRADGDRGHEGAGEAEGEMHLGEVEAVLAVDGGAGRLLGGAHSTTLIALLRAFLSQYRAGVTSPRHHWRYRRD